MMPGTDYTPRSRQTVGDALPADAIIERARLIVNGDLTIAVSAGCGQGNNPGGLCVSDRFEVGGTITGLDDLNDPPQDCQKPASGPGGNDEWTSQPAN